MKKEKENYQFLIQMLRDFKIDEKKFQIDEDLMICPHCDEQIKQNAIKCKYCKEFI